LNISLEAPASDIPVKQPKVSATASPALSPAKMKPVAASDTPFVVQQVTRTAQNMPSLPDLRAPSTDQSSPEIARSVAANRQRPARVLDQISLDQAPAPDTEALPTPATRLASPRPIQRPRVEIAQQIKPAKAPSSAPRAASKATGSKTKAATKTTGNGGAAKSNKARQQKLRAAWGAKISSKVQRSMRWPSSGTGDKVTLQIALAPNGRLLQAKLVKSSGNPSVDKVAMRTVKRIGRFAKAPKGMTAKAQNWFKFRLVNPS
jgi:protein TonB